MSSLASANQQFTITDTTEFAKFLQTQFHIDSDDDRIPLLLESTKFLNKFFSYISLQKTPGKKRSSPSSSGGATEDDFSDLLEYYKTHFTTKDKGETTLKDDSTISKKKNPEGCMWYLKSNKTRRCGKIQDNYTIKNFIPLCDECSSKKSQNKFFKTLKDEGIVKIESPSKGRKGGGSPKNKTPTKETLSAETKKTLSLEDDSSTSSTSSETLAFPSKARKGNNEEEETTKPKAKAKKSSKKKVVNSDTSDVEEDKKKKPKSKAKKSSKKKVVDNSSSEEDDTKSTASSSDSSIPDLNFS